MKPSACGSSSTTAPRCGLWLQRRVTDTDAAGQLASLADGRRCRAGAAPRAPPLSPASLASRRRI